MWDSIVTWFKSKGGFAHVVAGLYLGAVAAYAAVPAFKTLVQNINAAIPGPLEQAILAAIGIIAWYMDTNNLQMKAAAKSVAPLVVILVLLFGATSLSAQSGVTFTGTTEVTALNYKGAWGAANHTTESLDLIDWGTTKGNSLSIEGHQLVAPTPSLNAYMGGVRFTPDISTLIKNTNLSSDQFGVFMQAAAGVGTLPQTSSFAFFLGGGVNYRLTSNLSFSTVDFRIGRVGSSAYYEVSSGIQYIFNPQAAKSVSVKKFLAKRAQLASLKATIR